MAFARTAIKLYLAYLLIYLHVTKNVRVIETAENDNQRERPTRAAAGANTTKNGTGISAFNKVCVCVC